MTPTHLAPADEAGRATARRIFERYVYLKLGSRQIDGIKRSEISRLLDQIEDDRRLSPY